LVVRGDQFAANEELLLTGALLMAACYGAGALSSLLRGGRVDLRSP